MVTKGGKRDTITGAVVIAAAMVFLGLVYAKEDRGGSSGDYTVSARFNRLDGISVGSPVRIAGVRVGEVTAETLAPDFRAVTMLRIRRGIALPADSSAAIRTDGLLGAKYVDLSPGGDEKIMVDGDSIDYTHDAMVIEDLLDMIIEQGKSKRGLAGRALPSVTN